MIVDQVRTEPSEACPGRSSQSIMGTCFLPRRRQQGTPDQLRLGNHSSRPQSCQTIGMARTYWLDLFTPETWDEFLDHGGDVTGFSQKRWTTVQKIKPGDYMLCYLTRVSRWVGVLEVTGRPFFDEEPIWSSQVYPSRVNVKVLLALAPEHGVPVLEMREELTVFRGPGQPESMAGPVPRIAGAVEGR
jgi:hypothetical protein